MEQQNRYHVIVSERATQMLVSHVAFLAQASPEAAERLTAELKKQRIHWKSCRRDARGSQGNIFPEMLIDLSCLKNAI